ncbi:hypothetical protein M3P05_01940 [Sansalvadorimonas sp. 2012CJ34-2]|uniref:Uncharacterized protein n=1 Tax=Parendozoicomonas callyspongiae TaxID=2942213 RepID=A0ABT0PBH1_9GAMM|nr:hypothetical protein [Sansalvadorimonas sp. 2012CJ34-2]MCL6268715.1 hypothetical protein [Sansalvadorimonas sp. 2012CJ34-2]
MADWVDSAVHLLRAPPDPNGQNLLAAPEWMPGYLFQSLVFPRPYFRDTTQNATLSAIKKGGVAALALTASLVTKAALKYARPPAELASPQIPRDCQFLNPKGMVANLTKARTIIQLMTAEDGYDRMQRALILSGVSRWLEFRWKLQPEIADAPAHFWQWASIAKRALKIFTPLATGKKAITFSSSRLNQLFRVTFSSPLTPGSDPYIDIDLQPEQVPDISNIPAEENWHQLYHFCAQNNIQRLQLYPTTISGDSQLLIIRTWQSGELRGEYVLRIQRENATGFESSQGWWTNFVRARTRISPEVMDPLAPAIIGFLPEFLSATQSSQENSTLTVQLSSSHSSTHKNFAAVSEGGRGLLFLDWQTDADRSLIPRMTLITDPLTRPTIPVGDLEAIQNLQAQPEQPLFNEIIQASYDVFWLYLATRF